jgi:predicted kinase
MKQRIAQRHDDASEARLDVLVQQLSHVEPLGKDELPFVLSRDQA